MIRDVCNSIAVSEAAARTILSWSRGRVLAACLAPALVAGALYVNTLDNPFVYDDHRQIDENRAIQHTSDIRSIVLSNATRPLVSLSYAFDYAIWHGSPFGFHVTNVLIHVLNVVLLFAVAHRVAADSNAARGADDPVDPGTCAFVAALLFAVHPLMSQAVAYITGRSDLLATGFLLASFLAARRWLLRDRFAWLLVATALWVMALLAKETAIVLPVLLWAYVRFVLPPTFRIEHPKGLALLALTAVLFIVARAALFLTLESGSPIEIQGQLALTQLDVLRRYITLLLLPHGQTIFHFVPAFSGAGDPRLWLALVVAGAVGAWTVLVHRHVPIASSGVVWFVAALVPPAVLVLFDRGEPMAEHRAYLASCGAFLAAGALAARTAGRLGRRGGAFRWAGPLALAVVALSLAGQTLERNQIWNSRVALWTEAARYAPNHWVPQIALGEVHHDAGRHAEAVAAFTRSMSLNPREPATYTKLGVCLIETGRLAEAEAVFSKLGALVPRSAEASNGLATVALAGGNPGLARERFLHTLEFDPLNVQSRQGLATVAESEGHFDEAVRRCEEIQLLAPGLPGIDACLDRNRRRASSPAERPGAVARDEPPR